MVLRPEREGDKSLWRVTILRNLDVCFASEDRSKELQVALKKRRAYGEMLFFELSRITHRIAISLHNCHG